MDLAPCIFLLRMIDIVMHIALQRPIAAGRIGIQATAHLDRQVRRLLDRLHREISVVSLQPAANSHYLKTRYNTPHFGTCMRGFAMVSPLFFYQLALIALVWLCLLLQWAWPSEPALCPA